jgi:hypothetical protein
MAMTLVTTRTVNPEPQMGVNAFNKTELSVGLKALAMRIINLLLMEKGTISNCFDMGVGIGLYSFEIMSDSLVGRLHSEIFGQVVTYLPDVTLHGVQLDKGAADSAEQARSIFVKMQVEAESLPITDLTFVFFQRGDGTVTAEAYI